MHHGMSPLHLLVLFMVALALWAGASHFRGARVPKGPSGQKRPADVTQNAVQVMRIATGQEPETGARSRHRGQPEGWLEGRCG